jgi:hypothetical protein
MAYQYWDINASSERSDTRGSRGATFKNEYRRFALAAGNGTRVGAGLDRATLHLAVAQRPDQELGADRFATFASVNQAEIVCPAKASRVYFA